MNQLNDNKEHNKEVKMLRIDDATQERLKRFGRFGESYQDILNRLMDMADEKELSEVTLYDLLRELKKEKGEELLAQIAEEVTEEFFPSKWNDKLKPEKELR